MSNCAPRILLNPSHNLLDRLCLKVFEDVRDQNHPSHASAPLYKGISSNYVRDEGF